MSVTLTGMMNTVQILKLLNVPKEQEKRRHSYNPTIILGTIPTLVLLRTLICEVHSRGPHKPQGRKYYLQLHARPCDSHPIPWTCRGQDEERNPGTGLLGLDSS